MKDMCSVTPASAARRKITLSPSAKAVMGTGAGLTFLATPNLAILTQNSIAAKHFEKINPY
jgi:hypothetical protein